MQDEDAATNPPPPELDPMSALLRLIWGCSLAENLGDVKDEMIAAWRAIGLPGEFPLRDDGEVDTDALSKTIGLRLPDDTFTRPVYEVELTWHDVYGDESTEVVSVSADSPMWAARVAWQTACAGHPSQPAPYATAKIGEQVFELEPAHESCDVCHGEG